MTMRVLVTRPADQAERTAERLRAMGHTPLVAPLLVVEPTGAAPPPGPFVAVLATSANAVPHLQAWAGDRAGPDLPVFAIGERTAALAREAGFGGVRNAAALGGDAAGLVRLVRGEIGPSGAMLLVAGRDRKPEPASALAAAGYRVAVWEAYAAVAAPRLPPVLEHALGSGGLDAALHYSRRSAAIALALAEAAGLSRAFLSLLHHAISEDAAAPLAGAGASRIRVAAAPDEDSLMAALGAGNSRNTVSRC